MVYKRKRYAPYGGMIPKRRRFTLRFRRRGLRRRFKRSTFMSAADGRPVTSTFRTRRLKPSAYRRSLWRNTLHDAHYRSVFSTSFAGSTTDSLNTARFYSARMIGDAFWTVAAGA